mgnify:CR=1 FL=1
MNAKHWPTIEYRNGVITGKLSTTDPFCTMQEAKAQVAMWAEDFHILHAWIDIYASDEYHDDRHIRFTLF